MNQCEKKDRDYDVMCMMSTADAFALTSLKGSYCFVSKAFVSGMFTYTGEPLTKHRGYKGTTSQTVREAATKFEMSAYRAAVEAVEGGA